MTSAKDQWILDVLASGVYRVERDGRVIRVHKSPQAQTPEREVKTHKHPRTGYRYFTMSWKNHQKCVLLHRVVALAHIPNPMGLPDVDHENGDKDDCSEGNLEWVTKGRNQQLAYARGHKSAAGEKNGRSKLNTTDVAMIRASSDATAAVASTFGISARTVRDIRSGRTWF